MHWASSRLAGAFWLIGALAVGAACSAPITTGESGKPTAIGQTKPQEHAGAGADAGARDDGGASLQAAQGQTSPPPAPAGIRVPISIIEQVTGADRLLFVSDFAGQDECLARTLDAKTAELGPLLRLPGQHVVAAMAAGDGQTALVTSDGERLCVSRYERGADHPVARGCEPVQSDLSLSPAAVVAVGNRIALIALSTPPKPPPAASRAAPAPPIRKDKPKTTPTKTSAKKPAPAKKHAPLPIHEPTPPAAPKIKTDVRLRWVSMDGVFDSDAQPTGLSFELPLAGMGFVDAAARAGGVDLLWYETAPPPKTRSATASPFGRARLSAGTLRPDGTFDPATRVKVVEDELDYGLLRGHITPRMFATGAADGLVDLPSRSGPCQATRIFPTMAPIAAAPAICAVSPERLLDPTPIDAAESAIFDRILAEDPRRALGQPKSDPWLTVRVGDRVWFLKGQELYSASLADGSSRLEPYPFVIPGGPAASGDLKGASPDASAADGGAPAADGGAAPASDGGTTPGAACPADMVSIARRFCIDRFEGIVVDQASGETLSPDYPTTPNLLEISLGEWATARLHVGNLHGRAFPMPLVPTWQRGKTFAHVAVSRGGVRPNGYLTGLVADAACKGAGKRLCTLDEFVTACRGEDDTQFPYGDTYVEGACNVFRADHPAAILHDNASLGHLDPRLNRVKAHGEPLLRATGTTPQCRSRWGQDAAYDLVGNLDEWVDEGAGAFAGGFYSRATRAGCEAVINVHPKNYLDYSLGVRCCRDAAAGH